MPWTMNDYPNTWKNFDELERKKAIDIGNAMLKDGYKEGDVIPIATQAKDWYKDATKDELDELKHKHITQHQKDQSANPKLNDENVHVYFEDDEWKVKQKVRNKRLIRLRRKQTPLNAHKTSPIIVVLKSSNIIKMKHHN